MSADERPTLMVVQHVPWEGPHRILDACGGLHVRTVKPLAGQELPPPEEVAGAVVMGGPMNVDEVGRFPALAVEREWLAEAIARELPLLGICLGAQLLARALGAEVRPGPEKEIGFAPVEVLDATDPVLGGLAPGAEVLHWHELDAGFSGRQSLVAGTATADGAERSEGAAGEDVSGD